MNREFSSSVSSANGHCWCLMCGRDNPMSLKLEFVTEGDTVSARFKPSRLLQGYQGILHGGVVSALLDASMTHCLFHRGVRGVTAELEVRFLKPVPCTCPALIRAGVEKEKHTLYYLTAVLECDGEIYARGKAVFMKMNDTELV